MAAADRVPTPLLGVGVLVPVRLCALLAEELRMSRVRELGPVRAAALEVGADLWDRQQRADVRDSTVTATQAARMLGVTAGAVRQLCQSGLLEGGKDDGRWRIPRSAVERRAHEGKRAEAGGRSRAAPG